MSIHRLQAVLFNIAIGFWFIKRSIVIVNHPELSNCFIDPDISMNNLILMGLSAGTYAALKTSENKSSTNNNPVLSTGKSDVKNEPEIPPVG